MKNSFFTSILFMALGTGAFAANLQASNCQIFISKVAPAPSSHGITQIRAKVKVNWLGNDERIQRVGMYARTEATDLGNRDHCYMERYRNTDWAIVDPKGNGDSYGEYAFEFLVYTGSVDDACPGFKLATIGSFFVETDKNTYWLNPNLDSNQSFYFDFNGYQAIKAQSSFEMNTADREGLRYYNPLGCR